MTGLRRTKPRARDNRSPTPDARTFDPEVTVFQTARFTSIYAKRQRSATASAPRELRQSGSGGFLYGVIARQTSAVGIILKKKTNTVLPPDAWGSSNATIPAEVTS